MAMALALGNSVSWAEKPDEVGSPMDTSSASTRKSTMNEADENQKRHESKRLALACGSDVSVDTLDCVYLNVDMW